VSAVHLAVVQGEPLTVKATVFGGQTRWTTTPLVKGIIATRYTKSQVFDLAPHVTQALVGDDDIEFTLTLTGAQTRQIASSGVYDVFAYEGVEEAAGLRILHGDVMVERAVTP
jgi:hypothetical protein